MIILNTGSASQDISFIPREVPATFYVDILEQSSEVVIDSFEPVVPSTDYFSTFSNVYDLTNQTWYLIKIYNSPTKNIDTLIYYDTIYCTDQDVEQITILENITENNPTTGIIEYNG